MDWDRVIMRNRDALLRVLAGLVALVGLDPEARGARVPRPVRNQVLRLLRPAESAFRRLVMIAARDLVATVIEAGDRPARNGRRARRRRGHGRGPSGGETVAAAPGHPGGEEAVGPFAAADLTPPTIRLAPPANKAKRKRGKAGRDTEGRAAGVPLLDPRLRLMARPARRRARGAPRITSLDPWSPMRADPPEIVDDGCVDATAILGRLAALRRALGDMPRQARRLACWKARRRLGLLRAPRWWPIRPGRPPGYQRRDEHEVDVILHECHALAIQFRDTS